MINGAENTQLSGREWDTRSGKKTRKNPGERKGKRKIGLLRSVYGQTQGKKNYGGSKQRKQRFKIRREENPACLELIGTPRKVAMRRGGGNKRGLRWGNDGWGKEFKRLGSFLTQRPGKEKKGSSFAGKRGEQRAGAGELKVRKERTQTGN